MQKPALLLPWPLVRPFLGPRPHTVSDGLIRTAVSRIIFAFGWTAICSCGSAGMALEAPTSGAAPVAGTEPAPSGASADRAVAQVLSGLDALYSDLDALYIDLHAHPELSLREERTSAKMAQRLRRLGCDVTEGVGGFGVVGILKSGEGPTVMLRCDMDALPIEERTGLPYSSRVRYRRDEKEPEDRVKPEDRAAQGKAGSTGGGAGRSPGRGGGGGGDAGAEDRQTLPAMHACGHDVHMTCWVGAATLLAGAREAWRGTLLLVAQPAEERGGGAAGMLRAGLFTRWRKPDYALALHVTSEIPSGNVGITPGYALANVDSVEVTVFGRGGHGAHPHRSVDPVVIAAKIVLGLQTIVSREMNPLDPAVITVGSIHGGTQNNIIPSEVRLQLTVRSYKDEVRSKLHAAIERVVKGEAAASGAPREPDVKISGGAPATYNDPELTRRAAEAFRRTLGPQSVEERPPTMGGEDFSFYGREGVPALIFWLGTVEPSRFAAARAAGEELPPLHSPEFAPDRERTLRTGVRALVAGAMEVLGRQ